MERDFSYGVIHMPIVVDQLARDQAWKAISMVEAHERICMERARAAGLWRSDVSIKLDHLADNIKGVYSRIWVAACGIIALLLACCGYLISHHGL